MIVRKGALTSPKGSETKPCAPGSFQRCLHSSLEQYQPEHWGSHRTSRPGRCAFVKGRELGQQRPATSSHQSAHVTEQMVPRFYVNSVPISPLKILYENKHQHSAKCTSHFKLLVSKHCFKTNKTCLQDTPLAPPCVCTFKGRNTPPSSSSLNVQERASFSFQPKILQGKPLFLKLIFFF